MYVQYKEVLQYLTAFILIKLAIMNGTSNPNSAREKSLPYYGCLPTEYRK
jgi:hypothetical protein